MKAAVLRSALHYSQREAADELNFDSFPAALPQVYDFSLPLLVLHAFYFKRGQALRDWLRICPRRQFTVLDTHDGMGIDDIAGLASVVIFSA